MGGKASQITSFTVVYSTVYSDANQRKHQSSASLAFVSGIHRGPVNSPHKWTVTRKIFPFDGVIMLTCVTRPQCTDGDNNDINSSMLVPPAMVKTTSPYEIQPGETWWRHQMETFFALLAICAGNSPVPGEFPTQRPVTRSFDAFFHLCLNKRLNKQPGGWWFEMLSRPLWRQSNGIGNLPWCLCEDLWMSSVPW